jgi:hypothetical protein
MSLEHPERSQPDPAEAVCFDESDANSPLRDFKSTSAKLAKVNICFRLYVAGMHISLQDGNRLPCRISGVMTDSHPFATFDLVKAIELRWILRDIAAKRLKLSQAVPSDLRTLINLGLVEIQDDVPFLTRAGMAALA